jgi:predicted permease
VDVDWRVLGFSFAVSLASGVLFGLVPAIRASRPDLTDALKQAGRGASDVAAGRGHRTRSALVVGELALAVLLLVGAGLLVRSFANLQGVDPGFNPRGVLAFALQLAGPQYAGGPPVLATYKRIWERLDRVPGVRASGGCSALPLTDSPAWTPISIEGRVPPPGEQFINTDERVVAGRYFEAMEIPLVAGRFFDERDVADSPGVVVVDERFAREFWPKGEAVGKRVRHGGIDSKNPWLTVVGVVGRVKHQSLDDDPRIALYLPHGQAPTRTLSVVVRGSVDPASLAGPIRRAVAEIDPALPLYSVREMAQHIERSLARQRFTALLLTIFALLALVVAAVGTYGVMAYLVGQGTREIGIRMALGAGRGRVLGMVVGQGARLAVVGVGAGLAGALALSRYLDALLFGVSARDPLTFVVVPAVLFLVALAACYVPARRAARVDPMVSLRCE